MRLIASAKSYTMYQRANGTWYVNFRAGGRQVRLSTGRNAYEEARALVETFRAAPVKDARPVDDKHLYRMIERARYKHRNKATPFGLTIGLLREIAGRCKGHCEVTGHALEDSGPFRPSLDRIVPELGYVPGNVRIVCLITNTGMLHYGEAAFAELAIAYCRNRGLLPPAPSQPSN